MPAAKTTYRKLRNTRFTVGQGVLYLAMLGLVLFTSLPLLYLVSTAFKPYDELFLFPPRFLVRKPTMRSFSDLLTAVNTAVVPFSRYVFNSVFTSASSVAASVIVCSLGAFALAKYRIRGADVIFKIIIAGLMFSPHVTQIPSYMVVSSLGMLNTYWSLIIPKIAVAYSFFLMKQFSTQIPDELLEAARIDGARDWRVFWRIAMPLLKPAWSTLIVLSFISNWNDYFSPLVFVSSQAMKTLPLALQTISSGGISRSGAVAAAALLATAPTVIVFVFMQSRVIKTMAYSGIKA